MAAASTRDFLTFSPEYTRLIGSCPEYDSEMIEQFLKKAFQDTGKSEINRRMRLEVMKRFRIIGKIELDRLLKLEMTNQRSCGIEVSKVRWLSEKEISETFQEYIQELERPECYQALNNVFNLDRRTNLTNCICLGLGPFAIGLGNAETGCRSEHKNTSLHQLAVLTVILRILGSEHRIQKVYFQDPVFTRDERAFLRSLGYEIIEDPGAYQHICTSTLVFAPFLGWHIIANALKVAFPALYIGVDPATYLEALESQSQSVPNRNPLYFEAVNILRRFRDATLVGKAYPRIDKENWTPRTTVHWLSPAYEEVPEGRESDLRNNRITHGRRHRALQVHRR